MQASQISPQNVKIAGSYRSYLDQQLICVHSDFKTEFSKGKLCCCIQAVIDEIQLKIRAEKANLICGTFECTDDTGRFYTVFVENNNVFVNKIEKPVLQDLKRYLEDPFPETKCSDIKELLIKEMPEVFI